MDLSGFQSAVARKSGIDMDATALTEWINEAIQAITEERDWPWLDALDTFDTTADTAAYDLPSDWRRTRDVVIDSQPASRIDPLTFDAFNYVDSIPAIWNYAIIGGQLAIAPTPSGAVSVSHRYAKTETALSGSTDTPALPARFHQAVVAYAAARVLERMPSKNEGVRAQRFDEQYQLWLKRMRDAVSRDTQPTRVRVRSGSAI